MNQPTKEALERVGRFMLELVRDTAQEHARQQAGIVAELPIANFALAALSPPAEPPAAGGHLLIAGGKA